MKTDVNGCSTCPIGQEQWEPIKMPQNKRIKGIQYDYRHPITGSLFSCIAINLNVARQKKDEWQKAIAEQKPLFETLGEILKPQQA
jgi:hypothetical protein